MGVTRGGPRRVAHVYFSAFRQESRVGRAAAAGLGAGLFDEARYYGYLEPDLLPEEASDPGCWVVRVPVRPWRGLPRLARRVLQFLQWNLRVVAVARRDRPALVQCHSLAALPASVALRFLLKSPLLYDAHELESERNGWPKAARRGARLLERALLPWVDHTIVVSDSIRDWYRRAYGLARLTTVRNMASAPPADRRGGGVRDRLGLKPGERLFVYIGAIGPGRGVEITLEAFARTDPRDHILFLGAGPLAELVRERARSSSNVHHLDPVPFQEVCGLVKDADVGLVVIERGCASHDYCLPSKLFESLNAGLPVLCSRLTELTRFVGEHRCGWLIEPSAWAMLDFVGRLGGDELAAAKSRVAALAGRLTWEVEREELLAVYRSLLGGEGAAVAWAGMVDCMGGRAE